MSRLGSVPYGIRRNGGCHLRGDLEGSASLPQSPALGGLWMAPVLRCALELSATLTSGLPAIAVPRRFFRACLLCRRAGFIRAVWAQQFVDGPRYPQPVEQDGQLPGYCHNRSPCRVLAALCRQLQALPPHITIFPKRAQKVMRTPHQQPSQHDISRLGDAQLGRAACGY